MEEDGGECAAMAADSAPKKEAKALPLAAFVSECAKFYDEVGEMYKKQSLLCKKMFSQFNKGGVEKQKRVRKEPWVPTGYQRFMSKRREEFKTELPDVKGREIMKRAAAEWNSLTEAEKAVYNEASTAEREKKISAMMAEPTTASEEHAAEPEASAEQDNNDEDQLPRTASGADSEKKKKKKKRKKTIGGEEAEAAGISTTKKKKKKKSEAAPSDTPSI